MKKDFKTVVAEVKQAYNIVDYIETSGISLTRAGTSKWKGLCPFHSEKTPSFVVDENFQNYMCFGCGAKGDIIKFVEEIEHLDFNDVLRKLAEDKNIQLDFDHSENSNIDYKSLRMILKDTANFYVKNFRKLELSHPAKKEILKRGLSLNKVHYGYSLENRKSLYNYLKDKGYSDELLEQAGIVIKFDNGNISDFFNGRLMFIITDVRGRPIGFSSRKLYESDKRGKYVNLKDTVLFDKGDSLYNLSNAREIASKEKTIYIVEGQFDVSAFIEAGVKNVVASSGTAFTEKQALNCRRIVGENGKMIFAFDGDNAGIEATMKVFNHIPVIHSQSLVVIFPDGTDPDEYRQKNGNDVFVQYLKDNAVPMIQFVLDQIAKKYDLDDELEKNNYVQEAVGFLKQVHSNVLRESYIKRVALAAFVSVDVVRNALKNYKVVHPTKKTEEMLPIENINDENNENELIQKIINDPLYDLYARMIRLAIGNINLLPKLSKMVNFVPDDLQGLVKEVSQAKLPLIPEMFEESEVFEFILNKEGWFELAPLMDDDEIFSHFKFLFNKSRNLVKNKKANSVRRKISKAIENSDKDSVDLLRFALAREQEILSKN